MKNKIQKSGQRVFRKFSRASYRASEEGKEHIKENLIDRFSHITSIKLLIVEWALLVGALIMLAVTQAFWFGDSYSNNTFIEGGTYTEATLGEVNSMNPLFATTDSEKVLSKLMFSTLSTVDYSGHVGIGLAKSIRSNEDGSVWTVRLRDGLKWSDGEPITNEDVIFTASLIKNPAVNTIYDSNLAKVKITEDEKGALVFTLPSPYVDFITSLNIPILPKHVLADADPHTLLEHSFSNTPVTSGAFNYNAMQTVPGGTEKVFYLSANPDYYMGKVMLGNFAVHTFSDKNAIIDALNSGSVTATAEISGADTEKVTSSNFNMRESSLNAGAFMFFNTTRETVKSADMRKTVRQGLNFNKIREAAPETAALDFPLLESQLKLSVYPEIPAYNYNAAKAHIAELLGNETKTLSIATVNTGHLPAVSEVIKSELEGLGFEVELTVHEENQDFINNVIATRNYDILVYEIDLGAEPDLLPYFHSSQVNNSGLNLSNYRNAMLDDLLLSTRNVVDEGLKVKKYESLLEYWMNGAPAIGLYQPNLTYYYNKNVRTFSDNVKLATALDRFSDINSWAVTKATKNKTP